MWALLELVATLSPVRIISKIAFLMAATSLLIWAGLELTRGANYFRRALGLIVLLMTIAALALSRSGGL